MAVDLETIQDVHDWLSRPENQFDSRVFIVKWDGHTPRISSSRLKMLQEEPGLAEVILVEHKRRKRRPDEAEPETDSSDQ